MPGWKFYSLLLLPHCKLPFRFYIPLLRYRFYYFHPVSQVLCIAIRVLLDLTRLPYNKFHSLLWKASVVSGHFQNFRSLNWTVVPLPDNRRKDLSDCHPQPRREKVWHRYCSASHKWQSVLCMPDDFSCPHGSLPDIKQVPNHNLFLRYTVLPEPAGLQYCFYPMPMHFHSRQLHFWYLRLFVLSLPVPPGNQRNWHDWNVLLLQELTGQK